MKLNKNFEDILLNREQFDLNDYIIFIEGVDKGVSIQLNLIVKYDSGKCFTATEVLTSDKNIKIKPLTYFNKFFLYSDSYGYPVEYELVVKTSETFYEKSYIEFKEVG